MISYIGSKSKISSFIIPFYPKDMETYVEVFGGAFNCFFKMKLNEYPNLKKVVYNDLNKYIVNLFKCSKNYEEFHDRIKDIPVQHRETFDHYKKLLFTDNGNYENLNIPDYDVAIGYACIMCQLFSGSNPEKATFMDLKGKYKSKFQTFKEKLMNPKFQNYLNNVTNIEMLDFEELIKKYDSETTYFYLDPPYFSKEFLYYKGDDNFGRSGHERLANCLKNIKGKFSLSYYYFPELEEWYPKDKYKWEQKDFKKPSAAVKGKEQPTGTELLIMNY